MNVDLATDNLLEELGISGGGSGTVTASEGRTSFRGSKLNVTGPSFLHAIWLLTILLHLSIATFIMPYGNSCCVSKP